MVRLGYILLAVALLWGPPPASAQATFQFLPEIDVSHHFSPNFGFWFQVKQTRENGQPNQAEFGPSLKYVPKGRLSLDPSTGTITLALGYRYLAAPEAPGTNRLQPIVFFSVPLKGKAKITDRNRADLDWQNGSFTWTYRNRLAIKYPFTIRGYTPRPYAAAEAFYRSQYSKWSDTALYAGCEFPLGKHTVLEPYYEHQNVTGKSPNQQYNQIGVVLNLLF